jgi:hypothetical protein
MGEVITACKMFIRNSKRGCPLGGIINNSILEKENRYI